MNRFGTTVLFLVLFLPCAAVGQAYSGSSCVGAGNAGLKALKVGGQIKDLNEALTGAFKDWATSTLKASGQPPPRPSKAAEDEDFTNDYGMARDEWSCMYSALRAFDGNKDSAWCEGVAGQGVGEVMVVRADAARQTAIWGGFGKSEALFLANSRPRKIKLWVLQAQQSLAHQYGTGHGEIHVLAEGEAELKDQNGFQDLPVPKFTPLKDGKATFLAIQILSVYPGKKYQDTCISEVVNPEG
jgi:hypothetical protein